jgi:hypothetical protein
MILGLDQITFAELKSSKNLIEALHGKLGDLDTSKFPDRELARKVNLLTEILRETLLDRYQALTVRAFAHITVALDYFLTIHEQEPGSVKDTLPGGYVDDLVRINAVFNRFDREIQAFQQWKSRQPDA